MEKQKLLTKLKELAEKYQPLKDYVLLYRAKPELVSKGGIVLPQQSKEDSKKFPVAFVIALGPEAKYPSDRHSAIPNAPESKLKFGDKVAINTYFNFDIPNVEELCLTRVGEIACILKEDE